MTGLGTIPAPETQPDSQAAPALKSPPQTIREFESALRVIGFTGRQAKAIAAGGFKAITVNEQDDQLDRLVAALRGARTESNK